MLCEKCGMNEATVKVTQIINGHKTLKHLCHDCAQADDVFKGITLGFGGMFPEFSSLHESVEEKECPLCKMKLSTFLKTSKPGCGECYSAFEKEMAPLLKKIHATNIHSGKVAKSGDEKVIAKRKIDLLKAKLQDAVKKEQYEEAAKLRDEIKEMEGEV